MSLKIRRGTDAERLLITPEEGELIYTTDTKELYVGDGETPGGNLTSDNNAGTVTSVTGTGTVAGIALSGTVTTSGNLTLGGTLAVPITNITATGTKDSTTFLRGDGSWAAPVSGSTLPTQTGNSGKVLTTDGTNLSWTTNGNGTVTSVTGTGTVAGISLSGTVNSAGSLTLSGTLAVPIGNITATGTSDSTTFLRGDGSWAIPVSGSLLPTQIGNNGKVLTTDGTSLSWITPPMGGTLTSDLNTSAFNVKNGTTLRIEGLTGNILSSYNTVEALTESISNFKYVIDSTPGGWVDISTSRGSFNNPSTLLPTDQIGGIRFNQHNGDNFLSSIAIVAMSDATADYSKVAPAAKLLVGLANNDDFIFYTFNSNGSFSAPILETGSFNGSVTYPSNPSAGMIIFDSNNNHFYGYNGTIWKQLDN